MIEKQKCFKLKWWVVAILCLVHIWWDEHGVDGMNHSIADTTISDNDFGTIDCQPSCNHTKYTALTIQYDRINFTQKLHKRLKIAASLFIEHWIPIFRLWFSRLFYVT